MVVNSSQQRNTRERILETALEIFAEEGFAGTSISEIERRVGLAGGRGGFYRHFPSKEALLREAAAREVTRMRADIEKVRSSTTPDPGDPLEAQVMIYREMLQRLRGVDRLFRLMLNEGDRVPELREAIWAALQPPISWIANGKVVEETIAMAALGGYHLFSIMQGRPYNGVDDGIFLNSLAEMIQRPPGAKRRGKK